MPVWLGWGPLLVLVSAGLWYRRVLPPWQVMVVMFFGMYAGFKWFALWAELVRRNKAPSLRVLGFLFFSAGVDAGAFLDPHAKKPPRTSLRDWLAACGKVFAGAYLIYSVTRRVYISSPYFGAWIGMIGCVLVAHFGAFHLLALAWRRAGIPAQFVMLQPMSSTSLTELWGRRWNLPFRDMMHTLVFQPLSLHLGATAGMLAVFFVSGLLHEMVISVPARGGYGLPTVYFLLQATGVMAERSRAGRRLGLRVGWRGWGFAFLVAALPAAMLFHPPFLHNVGAPFLAAIGALP